MHRQDQSDARQGRSAPERSTIIDAQDLRATDLGAYAARRGAYSAGQGPAASAGNVHMRRQYPANPAYFDSSANTESGSQYMTSSQPTSFKERNDPYHPTTNHHVSGYQGVTDNVGTQFPSVMQNTSSPYQLNATEHILYRSAIKSSPDTVTFAASPPWVPTQRNPSVTCHQSRLLTSNPSAVPQIRRDSDVYDTRLTPVSDRRHRNHTSSSRLSPKYDGGNFAERTQAASSLDFGDDDWANTVNLLARQPRSRTTSTASSSIYYGQGRRATFDSFDSHSGVNDPLIPMADMRLPSRQDVSSYARSTVDTTMPQASPLLSLSRRTSTNTSATNTRSFTQGSDQNESAPRFNNLPNPLPCEYEGCLHAARGHDRITNMRRHVRERHKENNKKRCPSCEREFTRSSAIVRHQKGREIKRES